MMTTESSASTQPSAPAAILRWLRLSESALGTASSQLNAINIFPVADGDTGSNLYDTVAAARQAVEEFAGAQEDPVTLGEILAVAGEAALDHAHGNSGTLLAVIINSLAEPFAQADRLTAPLLAEGLDRARTAAWSALSDPQEGTILSVLTAVTETAEKFLHGLPKQDADYLNSRRTLQGLCAEMVVGAKEAVRKTEQQLAELTAAQVVDAGGIGLLLVVVALDAAVSGKDLDLEFLDGFNGLTHQTQAESATTTSAATMAGWEVMCSLQLTPLDAATLRMQLNEVGDSVIMTPVTTTETATGAVRWRVHVHVPAAEDALSLLENAAGAQQPADLENLSITELTNGLTAYDHEHQLSDSEHR